MAKAGKVECWSLKQRLNGFVGEARGKGMESGCNGTDNIQQCGGNQALALEKLEGSAEPSAEQDVARRVDEAELFEMSKTKDRLLQLGEFRQPSLGPPMWSRWSEVRRGRLATLAAAPESDMGG